MPTRLEATLSAFVTTVSPGRLPRCCANSQTVVPPVSPITRALSRNRSAASAMRCFSAASCEVLYPSGRSLKAT
ncbi:hypothetical protein DEI81_00395 [Curtobacterium sp. MCBD17_013]|nr:hypothetical protein DEI81_00395 [Curtobacterium sp. MCBD17_013]